MRVHYLQHVPFEGIGAIEDWVWARGHVLSCTELFRAPSFPALDDLDLLVVMGGPMNVYDNAKYPWLEAEKAFIKEAIGSGKAVLGICLGAQLLADVLGAPVAQGTYREIGWYPVELTEAGRAHPVFADFPDKFTALHWHGDTFAIPPGATHIASSAACPNQAFASADGRVVGLQFHLEGTWCSVETLVENSGRDLVADKAEPWVASAHGLLAGNVPYDECRGLLFALLHRMAATVGWRPGGHKGPFPAARKTLPSKRAEGAWGLAESFAVLCSARGKPLCPLGPS
jgi:GMP synthase (glutamine-hydrolysing)